MGLCHFLVIWIFLKLNLTISKTYDLLNHDIKLLLCYLVSQFSFLLGFNLLKISMCLVFNIRLNAIAMWKKYKYVWFHLMFDMIANLSTVVRPLLFLLSVWPWKCYRFNILEKFSTKLNSFFKYIFFYHTTVGWLWLFVYHFNIFLFLNQIDPSYISHKSFYGSSSQKMIIIDLYKVKNFFFK